MTQPVRIQRKRTKGFNLQAASPNGLPVVSVTRPGPHGNPFKVGFWFRKITDDWRIWTIGDGPAFGNMQVESLDHSLELFNDYATHRSLWDKKWLEPLRDKNVACWCGLNSPCHGNTLLRLANA